MKSINHKNTRFLCGNLVTGEKTTEASLTSNFTRQDLTLAGATTPYNLLEGEQRLLRYNLLPGITRRGTNHLQAYFVGLSTTLPPCNDRKGRTQEKTQYTV